MRMSPPGLEMDAIKTYEFSWIRMWRVRLNLLEGMDQSLLPARIYCEIIL